MISQKATLLIFVFVVAACSLKEKGETTPGAVVSGSDTSIIGGDKASASDAVTASTVSLINSQGELYSFCTGTLISKNLVMTAAHCLNYSGDDFSIYFGDELPKNIESANLVKFSKWIIHPEYKIVMNKQDIPITALNDIALVKLADEIPAFARPVPILDEHVKISTGDVLLLAGYGLVNEIEIQEWADGLNYVRVPVAKLMESIIVTDQTMAMGACSGDSGGPAYLETSRGLVVVGATRGPHEGATDCRHFGEYTNATMFKSFLLEQAKLLNAEAPEFTSEIK